MRNKLWILDILLQRRYGCSNGSYLATRREAAWRSRRYDKNYKLFIHVW